MKKLPLFITSADMFDPELLHIHVSGELVGYVRKIGSDFRATHSPDNKVLGTTFPKLTGAVSYLIHYKEKIIKNKVQPLNQLSLL